MTTAKLDGIPDLETLNGNERMLSAAILVIDIVSCLDTTSAHCTSNIKRMSLREDKKIVNKTTDELEKAYFRKKRHARGIVRINVIGMSESAYQTQKAEGPVISTLFLSHVPYLPQIKLKYESFPN